MKLKFERPGRPNDELVVDGAVVASGKEFEVSQKRARELLAELYPDVQEVKESEKPKLKEPEAPAPGALANLTQLAEEPQKPKVAKAKPKNQ